MKYLILFLIDILSIEIILRSKYIFLINSQIKLSKKATYIFLKKNISDDLKQKIITQYSILMIKDSLHLLFNMLKISLIISIPCILINNYFNFLFSIQTILISILFFIIYGIFRNLIKNV